MSAFENLMAERSAVAAPMLKASTAPAVLTIAPDEFTDYTTRAVAEAERALFEAHTPIDLMTVGTWLQDHGKAVKPAELLSIVQDCPTTANVKTYIGMVREAYSRRKLRDAAAAIMTAAGDATIELGQTLDDARRMTREIGGANSTWMNFTEMCTRFFDWMEAAAKGELNCVRTGIPDLDGLIGGLYPGEMTVLGARPAVGKSALGLFIAIQAAKAGRRVGIVSREMSAEAITQRAVSMMGDVRGDRLRKARLKEEEWAAVGDAINELSRLPVSTIYTVRNVEDLHRQAQTLKDTAGLDLLIVDYAQLMHTARQTSGRVEEIEAVSGALKEIAMELEIPVLTLAQVRRSGGRVATMPIMDELKGSGALEQDADGILFLHRPEADDDEYIRKDDADLRHRVMATGCQYIALNVAKQRQGQTGVINLVFDPAHMKYTCIQR